ncbi:Calx-beta domain-containing protein [Paenibacillus harenae]|uniref:Calx-beta domain-containing protein n=1 Tax=Paenibacillus harenae TaxID=306543 RepID=UPI00040663CF|nr:Calx-beta domain-containing protein [Paenibacillus harenae]
MTGLRFAGHRKNGLKKLAALLLTAVLVLQTFGSTAHAIEMAGEFSFENEYYYPGESNGSIVLTVYRYGELEGEVTVDYTTSDGSASGGSDYGSVSGTLTFAARQWKQSISIAINDDSEIEGDEDFLVVLSNPTNGSVLGNYTDVTVTIADNDDTASDSPGELSFVETGYTVEEGDGIVRLSISRTNGSAGDVTVNYHTAGGTATRGTDFDQTAGTLEFHTGETSADIEIPIVNDMEGEDETETFTIELATPTGGASIGNGTATITIKDDDGMLPYKPGEFTIEQSDYTITEDGYRVKLNVLRENGSDGSARVDYATEGVTAEGGSDYLEAAGQLIFNPGDTLAAVEVEVVNDKRYEGNESFNVILSNPTSHAKLGSNTTANVTIIDNDPASHPNQPGFQLSDSKTYHAGETKYEYSLYYGYISSSGQELSGSWSAPEGCQGVVTVSMISPEGEDYDLSLETAGRGNRLPVDTKLLKGGTEYSAAEVPGGYKAEWRVKGHTGNDYSPEKKVFVYVSIKYVNH